VLSDEPRSTLEADESRWWRYGVIQVWFDGDVVKALTIAWPLPRYTLPVGFHVDDLPASPPTWDDFHAYLRREHLADELRSNRMGTSRRVQMSLPSGVTLVADRELISLSVSRPDILGGD
jgi:hypothetical protein